jgi:hypothetical protein
MRSLALFLAVAILHFALSVAGILMALPAAFDAQTGFWAAPGKITLVWTAAILLAPLGWIRPLLPEGAEDLSFGMVAGLSVVFGAAAVGLFHLWRALRLRKPVVQ